MKRLAFIVEPGFLEHHVGVRNYIFSLYLLLSKEYEIHFVSSFENKANERKWFRILMLDRLFMVNNGLTTDLELSGYPADILKTYVKAINSNLKKAKAPFVGYSHFGGDLAKEGYDIALITNPWLVNFSERLPIEQVFGLVFDLIPNRYVFTNVNRPIHFAAEHKAGFLHFRDFCDGTFSISEAVRQDLLRYFRFDPAKTFAIPPLLPCAYFQDLPAANAPRKNQVILASPLDARKGLAVMPEILGAMMPTLESVCMYGGIRCSPKEFVGFMKAMPEDLPIQWFPKATSATVKRLFAESKLLVFPSREEGLGLPILEAQMCGTRVAARPIEPMVDYLLPGSFRLGEAPAIDGVRLREVLADESFDPAELQQQATIAFSTDRPVEFIQSKLEQALVPV